jgi:Thioesterase superfamily
MAGQPPEVPGGPHLRTVAMPRDANPSGDIFGGWTLSQMDLAGGTFAAQVAAGRVATVSIEAMEFLRPVAVGDEVSCYCSLMRTGEKSVTRSFACSDLGTETIDGSASSRSILSYPTATLLIGWRGHLRPVLRLVSEPWPTKVSSA